MARPKKGFSKAGKRLGRPVGTKNKHKKRNIPVPPPPDAPIDPNTPPEDRPLSPTERMFVGRYLVNNNATRSYQEVYQCSYGNANKEGPLMLRRPNVAKEIRCATEAVMQKFRLNNEDVIQELIRVAFSDLVCVESAFGDFLRLSQIPTQERRAIQSCKFRTRSISRKKGPPIVETTIEYKMHKKVDALGLLASYLGIRKTGIPDFEAFLALLPTEVAQQLKDMISKTMKEKTEASKNGHVDELPSTSPVKTEVAVPPVETP
jgi:hypothetical protein